MSRTSRVQFRSNPPGSLASDIGTDPSPAGICNIAFGRVWLRIASTVSIEYQISGPDSRFEG